MSNGRIYTPEFRRKIAARVDQEGLGAIVAIAADQELPVGTIYAWVNKYGTTARQELIAKREAGGRGVRRKKRKATVRVTYTGPENGGSATIPELIMQYKQAADQLLRAGFNKEFLGSLT